MLFLSGVVLFMYGALLFVYDVILFLHGAILFLYGAILSLYSAILFLYGAILFLHGAMLFVCGSTLFLYGAILVLYHFIPYPSVSKSKMQTNCCFFITQTSNGIFTLVLKKTMTLLQNIAGHGLLHGVRFDFLYHLQLTIPSMVQCIHHLSNLP